MNVLDVLIEKREKGGLDSLTTIEKLILACPNRQTQLEAAAELHELKVGRAYGDKTDLSELQRKQV